MAKIYHKLVRDRIPQIIEESGSRCVTEILDDESYLQMLHKKLQEELDEYLESGQIEELADLLEVMRATAQARGSTWAEVEAIRENKKAARGGFDGKILLRETD